MYVCEVNHACVVIYFVSPYKRSDYVRRICNFYVLAGNDGEDPSESSKIVDDSAMHNEEQHTVSVEDSATRIDVDMDGIMVPALSCVSHVKLSMLLVS